MRNEGTNIYIELKDGLIKPTDEMGFTPQVGVFLFFHW